MLTHQAGKIRKYDLRNSVKRALEDAITAARVPNTAVEYAVFEAKLAYKQGKDNCKMRSERDLHGAISIDGRNIHQGLIYGSNLKRRLKDMGYNAETAQNALGQFRLKNPPNTTGVCKLLFDRQCGKYFLAVPEDRPRAQHTGGEVAALDPGVTPLLTYYADSGAGFVGEAWYRPVAKLLKKSDALLGTAAIEPRYFRRCKLKKAASRYRAKAQHKVSDMQWKAANWLARSFRYIFLPKMRTRDMVSTGDLPAPVARAIMVSSQYSFRQKLAMKAYEFGATVILCRENYTSKTCTRCGHIKHDLGAAKRYDCSACGISLHRDYNGARNILLRNLSLRDGSVAASDRDCVVE